MFVLKSNYNSVLHEKEAIEQDYAAVLMKSESVKSELSNLKAELEELKSKSITKEKSFFLMEFDPDMETVSPVGFVKDKDAINKLVERKYLASNMVSDDFAVQLALAAAANDFLMSMLDAFAEELEDPEIE